MYEVIVNYKITHGFLKFVLKSSEPALAHSLSSSSKGFTEKNPPCPWITESTRVRPTITIKQPCKILPWNTKVIKIHKLNDSI